MKPNKKGHEILYEILTSSIIEQGEALNFVKTYLGKGVKITNKRKRLSLFNIRYKVIDKAIREHPDFYEGVYLITNGLYLAVQKHVEMSNQYL